jgi:hypothetical protein
MEGVNMFGLLFHPVHSRLDSSGDRNQGTSDIVPGRRRDRLDAATQSVREAYRLSSSPHQTQHPNLGYQVPLSVIRRTC